MSYIRAGHKLQWFKGNSKSYVYLSSPPYNISENFVEDFDDKFDHDPSFAELLVNIVMRETKDKAFAMKIADKLAEKLGLERT